MYKAMDGGPGQKLSKAMADKGFRLLGFYEAGIRHIMTTKKPINSFDDIQGLKIRTMGVPAHVASFNAFGAKDGSVVTASFFSVHHLRGTPAPGQGLVTQKALEGTGKPNSNLKPYVPPLGRQCTKTWGSSPLPPKTLGISIHYSLRLQGQVTWH